MKNNIDKEIEQAKELARQIIVHHFGSKLLVYDIETPQQMAAAIHAGADFLQGRHIGAPTRGIETVTAPGAETKYLPEYEPNRPRHELSARGGRF